MKNKKNIGIIVGIAILLIVAGVCVFFFLNNGKENKKTLNDVIISSYMCDDDDCKITLEKDDTSYSYSSSLDKLIIEIFSDYKEYIKLDLYYKEKDSVKEIIDYDLYVRDTNEKINVKSEEELRKKLGLYVEGTYTETFTFVKLGTQGVLFIDDKSTLYSDYVFSDDKNNEYILRYYYTKDKIELSEGKKYEVTFEINKDKTFGKYQYVIKTAK